jgi:3-deoxy-D-manno-octulosonic-acid transferase
MTDPNRSALLGLYLLLSRRAAGFARARLRLRQGEGKEDPERLGERMGVAGAARPEGRLVWFHAASVGEAASLLELLRRLRDGRPDLTCLVTTVTRTSAAFLDVRLPEGALHQYAPLDELPWVESFLDHWRPDLAVWTESELWPATLYATHRRGTPMLLINARISQRSFRRWRMARGMARALLGRFERILAQDELAAEQLQALGAEPERLEVTGTLKEGAAPLAHDEAERAAISRALGGRPLWLAASTHEGEEELVAGAHAEVRRALPNLALILVPRHPDRGDAVAEMLRTRGLAVARRSKGEPIDADTEVYLADTLGEMGLWYRMAPVSFVGGSLVAVGGHNPFEPALLGSAILHGPFVRNFAEAYARFGEAGAAIRVRDGGELARALLRTMAPDRAAEMAAAAWGTVSEGAEVTDTVIAAVAGFIDPGEA